MCQLPRVKVNFEQGQVAYVVQFRQPLWKSLQEARASLKMKTMLCFNRQILGIIGPAYYLVSSRPRSVTDHCQLKELSVTQ